MPRTSRPIPGGLCAHLVTRGNDRAVVFRSDDDFAQLVELMRDAQRRTRLDLLAWCFMPNHLHLVVRPRADGDVARWMQWLLTTHVQRHRMRHKTTGHVWQGRYKSFLIQEDRYLLAVVRYVERNPVRAGLVRSARDWLWSSTATRLAGCGDDLLLARSPVSLPEPWLEWVDIPLSSAELDKIRLSVNRNRPLGDPAWTRGIAERFNFLGTLAPRGRPRNL